MLQDLRYALGILRKSPGFTAIAIAALALGMGANTAIFSIVNAVLLRPLPYHDPDRLVTLLQRGRDPASPADFLDIRSQAQSYSGVATAEGWMANLAGTEQPEQLLGLRLSEGMFEILGVPALRGRTLLPEDFASGKDHVVVLGYGLWQRRFGGAPDIVGRTMLLDGESCTIVGVMPPSFRFAPFWITQAEMWSPLMLTNRATERGNHSLRTFARLKPGVTREQAQAEMTAICRRLGATYPETDTGLDFRVDPLHEKVVGSIRPLLLVLLGAVGLVLLIACANVANLALARAASRQKEIAVRLALGANRFRIIRQLITESLCLAGLGGACGLLLAFWGTQFIRGFLQPETGSFGLRMPRWYEIGIDLPVLLVTLGLCVVTGVLFGLVPALQASKADLNDSLKESGRGSSEGGGGRRIRSTLVVLEVAISLVVTIGAGLMVRSFLRLRAIDPGFDPRNVLTMRVSLAGQPQYVGPRREGFYRQVIQDVQALPGVRSASMISHLPLAGDTWGINIAIEGRPIPPLGQEIYAVYRVSRPGYLQTMRIRLLRGRDFSDRDDLNAPPVVIVNEKLAQRYWPNENPIGKRLTLDNPRNQPKPKWLAVVGVVKDVKQNGWEKEPENEVYLPFLQDRGFLESAHPWRSYMTLVVRTSGDPAALAHGIERAIWALNKNVPISHVESLEQVVANSTWQPRFQVILIGLFAGLALVLAAVGVYGVVAYSVTRRTHEIGIRMALGARPADVFGMVIGEAALVGAIGTGIGLAGAFALTRLLAKLLYGVSATDPWTFATVAILMMAVAVGSSYWPARRAVRVDPMVALRCE